MAQNLDSLVGDLRRISENRQILTDKKIVAIHKSLTKSLNNFLAEAYLEYADKDGRMFTANLEKNRKKAWFLNEVAKAVDEIQPELNKEIMSLIDDTYSKCFAGMVEGVNKTDTAEKLAKIGKEVKVRPEILKRAVNNNISKLTSLGVLEKNRAEIIYQMQQQINIGLLNGDRYEDMARRMAERTGVSQSRTMLITRTETHCNIEGGLMDGAEEASKDFADIDCIYSATWRTRKDGSVRPQQRKRTKNGWKTTLSSNGANHMIMEGKTVKVGEFFDLGDGAKTKSPGNSGEARHDCNDRCFVEYNIMTVEEFAQATGQTVEQVRKKYNMQSKSVTDKPKETPKPKEKSKETPKEDTNKVSVEFDSFPDTFKTGTAKKQTQTFVKEINGLENPDPDMLTIYNSIGKFESIDSNGIPLKVSYTKDKHAVNYRYNGITGKVVDVNVKLPKLKGDDLTGAVQTTAHELGHFIDMSLRADKTKGTGWFTTTKNMSDVLEKSRGNVSDEVLDLFKSSNKQIEEVRNEVRKKYKLKIDKYKEENKDLYENSYYDYNAFKQYKKGLKKLYDEQDEMLDYETRNALKGINNFTDIYDALSGGQFQHTGVVRYGHGVKYYKSVDNQIEEIWANYCALSLTRPDLIDLLKKDKPELVKALDEIKKEIVKKAGEM